MADRREAVKKGRRPILLLLPPIDLQMFMCLCARRLCRQHVMLLLPETCCAFCFIPLSQYSPDIILDYIKVVYYDFHVCMCRREYAAFVAFSLGLIIANAMLAI